MNVLFLDQYSDLGGAQQCLLDLMPAVVQAGWRAHVALPEGGLLGARLRQEGAAVHEISLSAYPSGRKSPSDTLRYALETPKLAATIRRLSETIRADLVYVNGPRLLPAAALAVGRNRPVLFHCHSHLSQRAAVWLVRRSIRRSRATVIACCRYAAQPIVAGLQESSVHVVFNGVGAPDLARPENPRHLGTRIGTVGRIAPEKGQAEFLGAARHLTQVLPRCRFIIAGDVLFDDPSAREYARKLNRLATGLPVEFLGWRDDAYTVLCELDLLVVPSTNEPATTRVILEAYACGTPVVAFPSGGIPEIVEDGRTGFLVVPPTSEALAERILALILREPQRLRQAAEAGRQLWRQRFTLERYRQQVLGIMAQATGASGQQTSDSARTVSTPQAHG